MFGGDPYGMFGWSTMRLDVWAWVAFVVVVCVLLLWMLCAMLRR